jgi:hypothetical protein
MTTLPSHDKEMGIGVESTTFPSAPTRENVEDASLGDNINDVTNSNQSESQTSIGHDQDHEENMQAQQQAAASSEYPGGTELAVVVLAINVTVFLMAMDRTIVATASPQITDHFHSFDDIGWYTGALMLTTSCFQLPLGKIYNFLPAEMGLSHRDRHL